MTPRRASTWRTSAIGLAAAILLFTSPARAQVAVLDTIGGSGGSPFEAPCPQGELLTGLDLWTGDDVDAVRPLCVPAVAGQFRAYPLKYGGNGGSPSQLVCPNDTPIVIGMKVGSEGATRVVNNIHFYCGRATAEPQRTAFFSARYDGPAFSDDQRGWGSSHFDGKHDEETQICPTGLVAVGIRGRSGKWLDALGLICGAPPVPRVASPPGRTVKPQGRVRLPTFDLAALAARGEAISRDDRVAGQVRNLQPDDPSRRGFTIGLAAAEGHTAPGPGKQKIRDALSPAEQGGFDDAVSFQLTRNQRALDDLAARGKGITEQDPLATELKNQQTEAARRGFDIGMAAAENNTAPGPGKDRIRDSLGPVEQEGFVAAVAFSLDRNR
ncbi:MAG TPA: hypothetical protein VNC59_01235, partial [Thermoanaerobaculia bacterium]|nr:hypothetical protein [Thermoanaerobaculia bacterium]